MADRHEKILSELLKKPGNNECADCGSKSKFYRRVSLCNICTVTYHWAGDAKWCFPSCASVYKSSCTLADPEYASYNIGIFLCTTCASVHRGMGAHISKVKHLKLDRFEDSQLERLKEIGNTTAKSKYEERVPPCYRRPNETDPQYVSEFLFFHNLKYSIPNVTFLEFTKIMINTYQID